MANRPERLTQLTHQAFKLAMSHGDEKLEVSPIDSMLLIRFGRVRSLIYGVNMLLRHDLPEEAMILGRELFTDSLQLSELARHDAQGRAAFILGMENQSLTEWEQMEQLARSLDPKHRTPSVLTTVIAARRKSIQAAMGRFGVTKLRRFRKEKQLAEDNGRLGDLMDFAISHRFVHRADMAQIHRTNKVKDTLGIHLANRDEDVKARVGVFAAQSALHGFAAVATIFEWSDPGSKEARRLLDQITVVAEKDVGSGTASAP